MPTDDLALNPPIQYSIIWLIIGLVLLLCIGLWFALMFWLTRRKKINTLGSLGAGSGDLSLDQLKAKYLQIIDQCYQEYVQKQTNLRGLHRSLSMSARYFVYEAKHIPAPKLTLADLKRVPYPKLSELVEQYYEKEFAAIEHGAAEEAVAAAKEFIQQWA